MKRTNRSMFACLAILIVAEVATAQPALTIRGDGNGLTFSGAVRAIDAGALAADPSLEGAWTFDLTVDGLADVASLGDITSVTARLNLHAGSFYNVPVTSAGIDSGPQTPEVVAFFPVLAADSFVTTPGESMLVGNDWQGAGTYVFSRTESLPPTRFQFGQITFIPHASEGLSAKLTGSIGTAGSTSRQAHEFDYTFGVEPPPPPLPTFESAIERVVGTIAFNRRFDHPAIAAADDHPNGVTMFAPVLSSFDISDAPILGVDRLFVSDDGGASANDSGDFGWSLEDLQNLVPDVGNSTTLTSLSGHSFELVNDGSVTYGRATIFESHQTQNGWIHSVDAEPIPIPDFGFICDLNADGGCDLKDLQMMYDDPEQFDFDSNGEPGLNDVTLWLEFASDPLRNPANPDGRPFMLGDVDLDFDVDSTDLGVLLNSFRKPAPAAGYGWSGGDFTMDGEITSADLGPLLNNFRAVGLAGASVVPEPRATMFAVVGVLWLLARRRSGNARIFLRKT